MLSRSRGGSRTRYARRRRAGVGAAIRFPYPREEGTVVVVDAVGIGDDSIAAQRVAVDASMQADDLTFDLTRASWTQRCWPGRGHQDFSAKPCL